MIESVFLSKCIEKGMTAEQARLALHCLDEALDGYTITKKEAAQLVLFDGKNANSELVNIYINCRMVDGCAQGTIRNFKGLLERFVDSLNCSVLDVTPLQIRLFLSKCQAGGASNNTIANYKQWLTNFYGWMVNERWTNYNPCAAIPKTRTKTEFKGALDQEEVKHIKFACRNLRERLLIEFLVSSGVRINEFVSIKFKDLDLEHRAVKVLGKGNKERLAYFSAEAKILLEEYRKVSKSEYIYGAIRRDIHGGYGAIKPQQARENVEAIYRRVADKIKLEKVTAHTFRRTFATGLLRRGVPLEQVSKLLGHACLQTTMRYVEINQDELRAQHSKFVA